MNSHWRQPAARRFFAMGAPLSGLQQQCIRKCHRRFNVHYRAERTGTDALAQLRHFRMKASVVSKPERDTGFARRVDCAFGIALRKSKGLLAKNVLSNLRGGDDLLGVHRMRSTKDNGIDFRILQECFETVCEPKFMSITK